MEKMQNKLIWTIVLTETSHIFCCVLPTIFSLASLMVGLGLIGAVPTFLLDMHDVMHRWEIPLLIVSGAVIFLGWAIALFKKKLGACCHDTGCSHGPCKPRRNWADMVLMVATMLFVVNVTVYVTLHRDADKAALQGVIQDDHAHQDHHH